MDQPLQLDVGVAQLVGVDEVLGQLACQPQHHRGDGGRRLLGVQGPRMLADDAKGQLPRLGFADQSGRGLDRQQKPVLAQQRSGEGMVGPDRRMLVDLGAVTGNQTRACEARQPGAHAPEQLSGGLAGERQAEHLAGAGVAVGDEPHDPSGHCLGLARTSAGDDHQRAWRSGDHRGLLVGGREDSERVGKLGGAVVTGHERPLNAACAGHIGRTGQCEQPSLTRAENSGPLVADAAAWTRSSHSRRLSADMGS